MFEDWYEGVDFVKKLMWMKENFDKHQFKNKQFSVCSEWDILHTSFHVPLWGFRPVFHATGLEV